MVTAGSLFSGIGGFCIGLKNAGVKVLWANENDDAATETFKKNNDKKILKKKSITELHVDEDNLKPVDILTAGFPCQSFSQAGERSGFKDARGRLFYEILRIVEEFGDKRPSVLLLENVPFLKYGDNGRWFEEIRNEIQLLRYWFNDANATVLNTADITELPQRRERFFMVAFCADRFSKNSFEFPSSPSKRKPLKQFLDLGKVRDEKYFLEESNKYYRKIMESVANGNKDALYQLRRHYVREVKDGLCPTLTANMGAGGHNVPFVLDGGRLRRLTEIECARLQGFDDEQFSFPDCVTSPKRYSQIGNTVSVPVVELLGRKLVEYF